MSVQSVDRALDILGLFSPACPRLGITEMSRALNLAKPTIHGLVRTLADRGFLVQDAETRKYSLGLKIHEMGAVLYSTLKINQVGAPLAQALAKSLSITVRIAIWDHDTALITLNLFPESSTVYYHQFGPRVPAHCSSIGKAILAHMPEGFLEDYLEKHELVPLTSKTITDKDELLKDIEQTRARGYALDDEECIGGLGCMGAPIFDNTGIPAGSLSVSGSPGLVLGEKKQYFARELTATAQQISTYMGWHPPAGGGPSLA